MKILKIKIGEVYINGKAESVFTVAFQKTSKKGEVYYEIKQPIFVQDVSEKPKIEKIEA